MPSTFDAHRAPASTALGASVFAGHADQSVIDHAHDRSRAFGLATTDRPDLTSARRGELSAIMEENNLLYRHATPVMDTLYEQIVNTNSMVILTSAQGMVLHALGDDTFLERASRVALTPGIDWSERSKGTNAIGTALTEERPVTVLGDQHYIQANRFLSCSCAPIFDPHGQIIGALDVSGDHRTHHQHTLALVRMSAHMIENHMFADVFSDAVRLHFHSRPEFIGTLAEGIAVFTPDGQFLSANHSAQFQLSLSGRALNAHPFSALFGLPISGLFQLFEGGDTHPRQLCLHNGVTVWVKMEHKRKAIWDMPFGTCGQAIIEAPHTPHALGKPKVEEARQVHAPKVTSHGLADLDTGDEQVSSVIHKLRRVMGKDIPIMIFGETGTGKDLLAQAIHADSNRGHQPFVSVNCASIPETLIESELFGYEEGAFTGARKKGAIGKIRQAHGGTLFLDEIGDMPKQLQARLLRVLQERKVSPLGQGKEVDVDIAVICATHKNLKDLIAKGEFREDLYYRLNGLVVRLPALRERKDFEAVIGRILNELAPRQGLQIAPRTMALFANYAWPGNCRQLHNILRTAAVMADADGVIDLEHLPDDFLDDCQVKAWRHDAPEPSACVDAAPLPIGAPVVTQAGGGLQDVALHAMALALRQHKGNVSAAAKALGVSRNTIYRRKDQLPADVWGSA